LQSLIESNDIRLWDGRQYRAALKIRSNGAAAAFPMLLPASSIHENATHQPSSDGQKVRAIAPARISLSNQTQISLVHQFRRLQGTAAALSSQLSGGKFTEFSVDEGQQSVACSDVPLGPFEEEL
jgi:hypothetical protein